MPLEIFYVLREQNIHYVALVGSAWASHAQLRNQNKIARYIDFKNKNI